jgi:hypothetical protein
MEQEQNTVPGLMLEAIRKREYPGLPPAEGLEQAAQKYPSLYDAHTRAVQRGEVAPVPVQKAEPPSQRDKIWIEITKRAAPIAAAQGISQPEAVVKVVLETPEGEQLYRAYRAARP